MRRRADAASAVVAIVFLLSACNSSSNDGDDDRSGNPIGFDTGPVGAGEQCGTRTCETGLICHAQFGYCTRACDSESDCGEVSCGIDPNGASMCLPKCGLNPYALPEYVCLEGKPVGCEDAGSEIDCAKCTCGNQLCSPGVGCIPAKEVGEPCERNDECASENCSTFAGVCRIAVGDFCDVTNCDLCRRNADWSTCSRPCEVDRDCGSGICVISETIEDCSCSSNSDCAKCRRDEMPHGYCYERCGERTCPGVCADSESGQYCKCLDCSNETPEREIGQTCETDQQCASKACLGGGVRYPDQVCVQTCATTAECAADARCVAGYCLPTCAESADCAFGGCATVELEGGAANVCDPRAPNGNSCHRNHGCRSDNCSSGCQNAYCQGECRGTAAVGEACAVDTDCDRDFCCAGICRSAC